MAVFNPAANRPLQGGKGSSPGFRFAIYAVVSVLLMFLDQRQHYLDQARYVLQGVAFPVQLAVSSPAKAITFLQDNMQARDVLEKENQELKNRQHELSLQVMRLETLERENGELRGLKDALPPVADRWLVGEIVLQVDPLRQRVLINRGASNGVFKGQTVIDDTGVLGQTTQVGPWSAEVILITDPEHAIPVENARTGERTIAEGAGDQASLVLPFLAANADFKVGDRLVTSGLGGVFPAGYPVAQISEVHKDGADPHARFRALPTARITTDREVVLVWFRDGHPAAPVDEVGGQLRKGNADMLPQPTPGKPKAAEGAAAPAATGSPPAAGTAQPPAAGAAAASAASPAPAAPAPAGATRPPAPASPAGSAASAASHSAVSSSPASAAPHAAAASHSSAASAAGGAHSSPANSSHSQKSGRHT